MNDHDSLAAKIRAKLAPVRDQGFSVSWTMHLGCAFAMTFAVGGHIREAGLWTVDGSAPVIEAEAVRIIAARLGVELPTTGM